VDPSTLSRRPGTVSESQLTLPVAPIRRRRFALIMGVATLCALGAGLGLAARSGADGPALVSIGLVILVGGLLSVPAMLGPWLIKDEIWGLGVLGITGARTLLGMGSMLILIEVQGLPRQPVVHALLAGVMILTTAEACVAVWQLQTRERKARHELPESTSPRSGVATPARRSL
jgi:hypothetical protein